LVFVLSAVLFAIGMAEAQKDSDEIVDITGKYQFLTADDTLALLEEDGKLKGYVDVSQSDEESDSFLSYPIVQGSRKKNHVEFKTSKIHQRYFRFAGTVERGAGIEASDPDYLRLVGALEIVASKGETGEEFVQRLQVVFKSRGKSETDD